jgi:hypothetical protein
VNCRNDRFVTTAVTAAKFLPGAKPLGPQPPTLVRIPEVAVKGSLIAVGFEAYDQRFLTGERRERTHFAAEPNPLDLIKSHIEAPFRFRIAVFNVPRAPLTRPAKHRSRSTDQVGGGHAVTENEDDWAARRQVGYQRLQFVRRTS